MKTWVKNILGIENYVSELDQFLKSLDNQHPPLSRSQQKEIKKYKRIDALRDISQHNTPLRENATWAFKDFFSHKGS